jgi:hypothetical protein
MEDQPTNYLYENYRKIHLNLCKVQEEIHKLIQTHKPIGSAYDDLIKAQKEFNEISKEYGDWIKDYKKSHGG